MGKMFDALMGRRTFAFKSSKLKTLLNLALSRISVLKNQRISRRSYAQSDVVQLLALPHHHQRALLRVEQVIKEDNMIDAFVMLEGYCFMILERMGLFEQHRECPEELNEAVSCLLYAASRCGEFPELQEIRSIFTRRYGKEFAARAIELRNNCYVNRQMILKLSPKQPSLENRLTVLQEIAADNNVVLQLQEITVEKQVVIDQKPVVNNLDASTEVDRLSDSIKVERRQYKDVADAAQAAFESAAYAAAAARAAVELSKSDSRHHPDDDPENHQTTRNRPETKDRNEISNAYEITEVEELKQEETVESMLKTTKGKESPPNKVHHERPNENEIRFDETEEEEEEEEGTNNSESSLPDEEAIAVRGSLEQEKRYPIVDSKGSSDSSMKKMNSIADSKPTSVRTRKRRL